MLHFYLPVRCGCPAALQTPAVPQGHLSPSTARITSEPCRCTVASLPAEPQSPHVLFLPQNTLIVLKRAAGAAGLGAAKNPHLTYFWFFPFFFPVFLVLQVSATAIHSKPTCQPQPRVVDPVPEHRSEQEDEFSSGICWQQPLRPQGRVCPRFPNNPGAGAAHPPGVWRGGPYESQGAWRGACRALSFSQQVASLSAFLPMSRSCFLLRPGAPRRGGAGAVRGGLCGPSAEGGSRTPPHITETLVRR